MAHDAPLPPPDVRTGAGRLPGLPAVLVGHAHATGGGWASGCTVVLPPPGTVGGVAVGGGAPGTRETDALAPGTLVSTVDAVVLSGGSAYGLAAADGVMAWCEEAGRGFVVSPPGAPEVRVPVVPAAVVFDLGRGGDARARPTAAFGRAACEAAAGVLDAVGDAPGPAPEAPVPEGAVGAGTGARVAGGTAPGGVGVARADVPGSRPAAAPAGPADARGPAGDGWVVAALVVANAAGTPVGTGPVTPPATPPALPAGARDRALPGLLNTTLAVVVTDAALDVASATRLAAAAQAGLARAVDPSHTLVDGDVVVCLATGSAAAPTDVRDRVGLEAAAAAALTQAFARAVTTAAAGGTMTG